MKQCPKCKEYVGTNADVCFKCKYDFVNPSANEANERNRRREASQERLRTMREQRESSNQLSKPTVENTNHGADSKSITEKITALTDLMQQGILTGDEFSRIVQVLSNPNVTSAAVKPEKSPLEKKYDECFQKHIINVFKSPASCKWPPLEESMIKQSTLQIMEGWSLKYKTLRYIETYIDAANSYGAMLRKNILIVIDSNGTPQMVLEKQEGTFTNGYWIPMTGVRL